MLLVVGTILAFVNAFLSPAADMGEGHLDVSGMPWSSRSLSSGTSFRTKAFFQRTCWLILRQTAGLWGSVSRDVALHHARGRGPHSGDRLRHLLDV